MSPSVCTRLFSRLSTTSCHFCAGRKSEKSLSAAVDGTMNGFSALPLTEYAHSLNAKRVLTLCLELRIAGCRIAGTPLSNVRTEQRLAFLATAVPLRHLVIGRKDNARDACPAHARRDIDCDRAIGMSQCMSQSFEFWVNAIDVIYHVWSDFAMEKSMNHWMLAFQSIHSFIQNAQYCCHDMACMMQYGHAWCSLHMYCIKPITSISSLERLRMPRPSTVCVCVCVCVCACVRACVIFANPTAGFSGRLPENWTCYRATGNVISTVFLVSQTGPDSVQKNGFLSDSALKQCWKDEGTTASLQSVACGRVYRRADNLVLVKFGFSAFSVPRFFGVLCSI